MMHASSALHMSSWAVTGVTASAERRVPPERHCGRCFRGVFGSAAHLPGLDVCGRPPSVCSRGIRGDGLVCMLTAL
jgi:hypothetical protein